MTGKPVKKKRRKLNYFFINGDIHKSLHINRGTDVIIAWSYPQHKRIGYTYSDVRRRMEPAFTTVQAGRMVQRKRVTLERAILAGHIERPQYTYGLDEHQRMSAYMWSEANIMELHSYLMTIHRGRPRFDGLITPQRLPSARELRAMVHQNEILYVKQGDEFVPTFEAENF